jgi:hypothetical protein
MLGGVSAQWRDQQRRGKAAEEGVDVEGSHKDHMKNDGVSKNGMKKGDAMSK